MSAPETKVLRHPACALIAGRSIPIPGDAIRSHHPARPQQEVWSGSPVLEHVDQAVTAAHEAQRIWSRWPIEKRADALRLYRKLAAERVDAFTGLLRAEVGKPTWDSKSEAELLATKVDVTLAGIDGGYLTDPAAAYRRVAPFDIKVTESRAGRCQFRPHGVMAVLGPFNFPVHLPNGHIVPALLMGNTVIFKPSDKTPATGQFLAETLIEALDAAGAPPGVVNLVQGGADVAGRLVAHEGVDGILFTGSWPVGRRILEANLDRPGRIVALELGGNNPTIVMPDADFKQAAIEVARAAFVTTGQRCTCTRRLIVHEDAAAKFVPILLKVASSLLVGDPEGVAGQQPFLGPMIRAEARNAVLEFQVKALRAGAQMVMESTAIDSPSKGHYITPGILQVERFSLANDPGFDAGCDVEVFGPLLRVALARDFDDAIAQANATRYGLASAIFTSDQAIAERFIVESRAGCVNVNTGTAGASGKLPFGGLGLSGNHRPAGSFSVDYCAYPVASLVENGDAAQLFPGMRFDDKWVS